MAATNINQTRRGYSYQDKFVLLQILINLRSGTLENFEVDKTFSGKKSVDAEIILKSPPKICVYEIKNGETFKTDKWKEVRDAMQILFEYLNQLEEERVSEVEFYLVISPELRAQIMEHWGFLSFIKDNGPRVTHNNGKIMSEIAEDYRAKFDFDKAPISIDNNKFIDFVKKINFKCDQSDNEVGVSDAHSPLIDSINSEIENISIKVGVQDGNIIIPNYSIGLELLENIRQSSEGRGINIEDIKSVLVKAFARRCFVSRNSNHEPGKSIDQLIQEYSEQIEEDVLNMIGNNQPTGPSTITYTGDEITSI